MAYDRNDRDRGRDSWRQHDDGGRSGERGFFERAGDQISSWFGDDDDQREGRHYRDHEQMHRGGHDRGDWRESGGDRGYGRPGYGEQGQRTSARPMTGEYGRSQQDRSGSQTPWDRDDYRRTSFAGSASSGRHTDPHYSAWRDRHLSELDRDYEEYHRERQQHFENDFGSWREGRQHKRQMLGQAREHMDVVGSDGQPLGKVDCISGDRVILTKSDAPDGKHHWLSCSLVDKIEDNRLTLNISAEYAMKKWQSEGGERALFERERSGEDGPHMLDRSFSGTYR